MPMRREMLIKVTLNSCGGSLWSIHQSDWLTCVIKLQRTGKEPSERIRIEPTGKLYYSWDIRIQKAEWENGARSEGANLRWW